MDNAARIKADEIAELRASLEHYEEPALQKIAAEMKLDLGECDTREDRIFLIADTEWSRCDAEIKADAERKLREEEKARREAFYQTKDGKKQRAIDEAAARDNAIRRVHGGFIRSLPSSARMQGTHQVDPASSAAGDHPVPDGRYRVLGSDWVMSFKDGKWASADLAHARSAPDWIDIPDAPGNVVGAAARPEK